MPGIAFALLLIFIVAIVVPFAVRRRRRAVSSGDQENHAEGLRDWARYLANNLTFLIGLAIDPAQPLLLVALVCVAIITINVGSGNVTFRRTPAEGRT